MAPVVLSMGAPNRGLTDRMASSSNSKEACTTRRSKVVPHRSGATTGSSQGGKRLVRGKGAAQHCLAPWPCVVVWISCSKAEMANSDSCYGEKRMREVAILLTSGRYHKDAGGYTEDHDDDESREIRMGHKKDRTRETAKYYHVEEAKPCLSKVFLQIGGKIKVREEREAIHTHTTHTSSFRASVYRTGFLFPPHGDYWRFINDPCCRGGRFPPHFSIGLRIRAYRVAVRSTCYGKCKGGGG